MRRAVSLLLVTSSFSACVERVPQAATRPQPPLERIETSLVDGGKTVNDEFDPGPPRAHKPLAILVKAAPSYLVDLPVLVSITYQNEDADSEYYSLPNGNIWGSTPGIGFLLLPVREGKTTCVSPHRGEDGERGVPLGAKESRTQTIDLSNYGFKLEPGTYRLSFSLRLGGEEISSAPVEVELRAAAPADAKEAARLRRLGLDAQEQDFGHWHYFLSRNWNTVRISPALGTGAKRQLALHAFLHRAFYAPQDVPHLDASGLRAVTDAHLQAEVAALELEMAAARRDPKAPAMEADLLRRHPGMAHRVRAIHDGEGALAMGRQRYGAESDFAQRAPFKPYAKQAP
jgi:hypothetical protein